MARRQDTAKHKLTVAERRRKVAQLRRAGLGPDDIADELQVSKSTVMRDQRVLLSVLHAEATADLDVWRSAQLSELQTVREDAMTAFTGAEDRSKCAPLLGVVIKAQEREAHLLGLDKFQPVAGPFVMTEERAAEIRAALPPRT